MTPLVETELVTADQKIEWADKRALARDEYAVARLIELLEDADEDVQAAAADALGHIGPSASAAWEPLVRILSDVQHAPWLRDTCAYALGRINVRSSTVIDALRTASSELRSNVAICARESLALLAQV